MSIARVIKKRDAVCTKSEVLATAAELFSKKGYAATSMADIASATNISKATIYHYFDNKKALFAELLQNIHRGMDAVITDLGNEALTDAEKINLMRSIASVFLDHRDVIRLLRDLSQGLPTELSKATIMRARKIEKLLAGPNPSKTGELRAHCALVLLMTGINPPRVMSANAVKKFNLDQFIEIVAGTLGIESRRDGAHESKRN
ncbi:MAG: helix-turn-helix domain-containing protein [Candidatus Nanopelagicaceae bacterium]